MEVLRHSSVDYSWRGSGSSTETHRSLAERATCMQGTWTAFKQWMGVHSVSPVPGETLESLSTTFPTSQVSNGPNIAFQLRMPPMCPLQNDRNDTRRTI